jgi:hypothetical protein
MIEIRKRSNILSPKNPTPAVLPLEREAEEKLKPCRNLAQVAVN